MLVVRFESQATLLDFFLPASGGGVVTVGQWESREAISKEWWETGLGFPPLRPFHRLLCTFSLCRGQNEGRRSVQMLVNGHRLASQAAAPTALLDLLPAVANRDCIVLADDPLGL